MVPLSRREVIQRMAAGAFALATGGCDPAPNINDIPLTPESGRLLSRPGTPTESTTIGQHALGLGSPKDGFFYVPQGYRPEVSAPLVLLLHGAGQRAPELLNPMKSIADEAGLVLLAVDSREVTWDLLNIPYRLDVPFIESALALVFRKVSIDPFRVSVAGFSDGASYAISIGRINGDLFRRVVAWSPGYFGDGYPHGSPRFFITHGTGDGILHIENASRRIVPMLRLQRYNVEYHEFDGGHTVPADLFRTATLWLAAALPE